MAALCKCLHYTFQKNFDAFVTLSISCCIIYQEELFLNRKSAWKNYVVP